MTSVALITGATGAIGGAIAQRLAARRDFEVVLLCRDAGKAERTVNRIRASSGNERVAYALVDLSSRASIERFSSTWDKPVHVLVNNAAIAPARREESAEGIEMQWATNVLAYIRLTEALKPWLIEAASARVINVASYWAGNLDLHDLEFKRRRYDQHQAYRQSKQANRMLTAADARSLGIYGITVNACHSGDVNSTLSNALGFGGHESPERGAATPVWLATDAGLQGITGKYFEHGREVRCRYAENEAQVAALEAACRGYL